VSCIIGCASPGGGDAGQSNDAITGAPGAAHDQSESEKKAAAERAQQQDLQELRKLAYGAYREEDASRLSEVPDLSCLAAEPTGARAFGWYPIGGSNKWSISAFNQKLSRAGYDTLVLVLQRPSSSPNVVDFSIYIRSEGASGWCGSASKRIELLQCRGVDNGGPTEKQCGLA
jgi:hypothetical protein